MSGPSSDLRARLLAAVAEEAAPTRAEHRRALLVRGVVVVLVLVGAFFALGGTHPGDRDDVALYGTFVAWLLLAAAAAWAAGTRGRSMMGRPRALLLAVAVGLAPALALSAELAGGLARAAEDPGARAHFLCFAIATGVGLAPWAFVVWLRRSSDPLHPRATGAALGAMAGAIGAVFVDLHCPSSYSAHVLLGHVLPAAALAVLGALLGPRLLGVRAR